ncbi:MAG: ribonuclease H-like domain-containing protein [Phycisphaerae bacterium]|nr:ribonuclease H-like domain-containing protein [Phycisphaerae bacterium]
MIRRHFSVFAGIGPAREQVIRAAGINHWDEFLEAGPVPGLSERLYQSLLRQIREWTTALDRRDAAFFAGSVPKAAHWALFDEFGDHVRYLDIETTGLSPGWDQVTVVGIFDGEHYTALVQGQGLSARAIEDALEGCKLLVTYFGSVFDVPFLRAAYAGMPWDFPHFDLCFAGRKVGLRGGLKTIERALGIHRDSGIADIDGFEAVRLWRAHERGHPTALKRLIEYNEADTRNLARLAPLIYERLCAGV